MCVRSQIPFASSVHWDPFKLKVSGLLLFAGSSGAMILDRVEAIEGGHCLFVSIEQGDPEYTQFALDKLVESGKVRTILGFFMMTHTYYLVVASWRNSPV